MEITVILKAEPALMALLENLGKSLLVFGNDLASTSESYTARDAAEREFTLQMANPAPAQTTQIMPEYAVTAPTVPAVTVPSAPVVPVTPPMTNPAPVAAAPVVPTAPARQYTMSELGVAGADLASSGKRDQLISLLRDQFGVQALTQLAPERYPEFAQGLRALGAKI